MKSLVCLALGGLLLLAACGPKKYEKHYSGSPSYGGTNGTSGGGYGNNGGYGGYAGTLGSGGTGGCIECETDTDGDGLADSVEDYSCSNVTSSQYHTNSDIDMLPDYIDTDSDNNGISDGDEAGPHPACSAGADSDGDAIPDYTDWDNDNDGISDSDEIENGTDPDLFDSDGNGCSDWDEMLFEECDPEGNVTLDIPCFSDATSTSLVLTTGDTFDDLRDDLSITVTPITEGQYGNLAVAAVTLEPSEGGTIENGKLLSIGPETRLTLAVSATFSDYATQLLSVRLVDGELGTLADGQVYVVPGQCPIPK